MLTVWGRRNSSNVQKVMWTVGQLGLEHQHHNIGGSFGGNDTPGYRTHIMLEFGTFLEEWLELEAKLT